MSFKKFSNKIYTGGGDRGETSLNGGMRVPKYHSRIEAYGEVDELNSFIGLLRDQDIDKESQYTLIRIQKKLFVIGSMLATPDKKDIAKIKTIEMKDVYFLENEIDRMQSNLSEINTFIIPGGNVLVSCSHIIRSICRRAERAVIKLSTEVEIDDIIIMFLNRLSDYFFVLARFLAKEKGSSEILWDSQNE